MKKKDEIQKGEKNQSSIGLKVLFGLVGLVFVSFFVFNQKTKEIYLEPIEHQLSGKLQDGRSYELKVRSVPLKDVSRSSLDNIKKFYGIEKGKPQMVLKTVELNIDGKRVDIPEEAYRDLGNVSIPDGVAFFQKGKDDIIMVQGGRDTQFFQSRFIFRSGHLRERVTTGVGGVAATKDVFGDSATIRGILLADNSQSRVVLRSKDSMSLSRLSEGELRDYIENNAKDLKEE